MRAGTRVASQVHCCGTRPAPRKAASRCQLSRRRAVGSEKAPLRQPCKGRRRARRQVNSPIVPWDAVESLVETQYNVVYGFS